MFTAFALVILMIYFTDLYLSSPLFFASTNPIGGTTNALITPLIISFPIARPKRKGAEEPARGTPSAKRTGRAGRGDAGKPAGSRVFPLFPPLPQVGGWGQLWVVAPACGRCGRRTSYDAGGLGGRRCLPALFFSRLCFGLCFLLLSSALFARGGLPTIGGGWLGARKGAVGGIKKFWGE